MLPKLHNLQNKSTDKTILLNFFQNHAQSEYFSLKCSVKSTFPLRGDNRLTIDKQYLDILVTTPFLMKCSSVTMKIVPQK